MSRRHRDPQTEILPKEERRRSLRRVRHEAKVTLMSSDPDEVVLPEPVRVVHKAAAKGRGPRRFRHWKAPFWKRRNAERHRRNAESLRLAE